MESTMKTTKPMKVYTMNQYGNFTPFDLETYVDEIKSQTYIKTRKEEREKARARKKRKEQTMLRRLFGFGMLIGSIFLCKIMIAMGERDVTYMLVLVPVALAMIFAKD